MEIPEGLVERVTNEPLTGLLDVIEYVQFHMSEDSNGFNGDDHDLLLEAFALIVSVAEADLIYLDYQTPDLPGSAAGACTVIWQYLNGVEAKLREQATAIKLESLKRRFTTAVAGGFAYEFTDGDIKRVQDLINELRCLLAADSSLDADHKSRLLRRLEALQRELHKKISDLSKFWTLVGDAGVALGKLGTDAKPIVDRIREIVQIGWKSQARAEELPSSAENPMLDHNPEPPALN